MIRGRDRPRRGSTASSPRSTPSCAGGCATTASPTTRSRSSRGARLPLRRPGLRAADPARRRARSREAALERVPPPARAGVRPCVPRPDRDRQSARHRQRQAAAASSSCRRARAAATRCSARARASSASTASCALRDALLRARRCSRSASRSRAPAVVFQRDTTTVVPPGWTAARRRVRQPYPHADERRP